MKHSKSNNETYATLVCNDATWGAFYDMFLSNYVDDAHDNVLAILNIWDVIGRPVPSGILSGSAVVWCLLVSSGTLLSSFRRG
jgi:hypothetical protein